MNNPLANLYVSGLLEKQNRLQVLLKIPEYCTHYLVN